jgi:hypothetical protein
MRPEEIKSNAFYVCKEPGQGAVVYETLGVGESGPMAGGDYIRKTNQVSYRVAGFLPTGLRSHFGELPPVDLAEFAEWVEYEVRPVWTRYNRGEDDLVGG